MIELALGVLDVAYSDANSGGKTTGDVAQIIEGKWHLFEIFFEERREKISGWIAQAMQDQIAALFAGRKPADDPYFSAMQNIEAEFRSFLDADEISAIMPLTQQITAAQLGKNSRKKSGYNKGNSPRPAFIDSGLLQASFRAWIKDGNLA